MAAYNSMYYSLYKLDNLIVSSSPTCVHDYILDRRLYFTRSYYTIYTVLPTVIFQYFVIYSVGVRFSDSAELTLI